MAVGSVAAGAFTQLPAQASAPLPGHIEICKSKANGMTGKSFAFTYTDRLGHVGSASVIGGGCSPAESVTGGVVTLVEAQGGTTVVQAISTLPTLRLVSSNLTTGTAVVRAPAGGTETVVTYTNVVPGAEIKVCKQAATNSTQLNGQPFSFTINGGAAFTVDAGPFGSPNCSGLFNYAAGTNVTVSELQPASNVFVSAIDVTQPPATNVSTNNSARTVSLTVGSGVNIVTYTNAIQVSSLPGYLEICKDPADNYVTGHAFSFSVIDAAGLTYGPYSVLVNQCTPAIQVTAGPATITEAAQAPYFLGTVDVAPSGNFISDNLTNGQVTANVAAGPPSGETVVAFWNATELGDIKVCKALDSANSDALAGTAFVFNWRAALSTGGTASGSTTVVANTFEQGPACVFINGDVGLPLGSIVTISEVGQVNVVSTSTQTVTVPGTWSPDGIPGNNITSVTFTNRAEGTIEICKDAADTETLGNGSNPFVFSISDGSFSASITVDAGKCSAPMLVPAGSATVTEGSSTNFHLVLVTATGPTGDNRVISGFNPVKVSVPFSGTTLYGNETLVTFTNAVNTGQFKICKTSSSSLDQDESFRFNWSYTLNNKTITGTITLQPGQCGYLDGSASGLSPAIPVVDNNGNPVTVSVSGDTDTGKWVLDINYYISSITYSGSGSLTSSDKPTGASSFTIGQGVNSVTYDNEPCASNGCPYKIVPPGTCEGSGSLSTLVSGTNVTSYIPKGNWDTQSTATGIDVVNVEGTSVTNTLIPTGTDAINSCASNSATGQTVCTANNNDVYILKGTGLDPSVSINPLTDGGSGTISFSGGSATTIGVSMDATDNKALLGISIGGVGGFQFLDLATDTFEPAFTTMDPSGAISEDPLIDPIHHLILSASEDNNYELVNVSTSTSPQFFEHPVSVSGEVVLDSSAEDCSTGIILAPAEYSDPSQVEIADISNAGHAPEAVFTPGSPGSWSAPEQVQTLTGSNLAAGASGSSVAQGTHTGVISGEFGGDGLTALALPTTSGAGAVPAISNWVSCETGNSFSMGDDPHTLVAYQSPNGGHAIALLVNVGATEMVRVDLTDMLNPADVPASGNVCTSGTLPGSAETFISLP